MFDITLIQKIPQLPWQAHEVIRELDNRPHLLLRITIKGGYFAHRAPEPFIRIVSRGKIIQSWFAEISEDNSTLSGYFPTDLPANGVIEYGYGSQVQGRLDRKFITKSVERLDRKKLPKETIVVSQKFLQTKRGVTKEVHRQ
ncbi:MAG: hypothetical protein ICV66_11845 [Chitinophagaceae bacterium]|nr:hypothetical protein [Chitinophagaceae bacterium]